MGLASRKVEEFLFCFSVCALDGHECGLFDSPLYITSFKFLDFQEFHQFLLEASDVCFTHISLKYLDPNIWGCVVPAACLSTLDKIEPKPQAALDKLKHFKQCLFYFLWFKTVSLETYWHCVQNKIMLSRVRWDKDTKILWDLWLFECEHFLEWIDLVSVNVFSQISHRLQLMQSVSYVMIGWVTYCNS